VTADRECTPGQVALQETGKIVSDLGGSITAGGAAAGAIGGIIAIGGALTGDVPAAGYGAIVMQRGANTIAVGGFVTYTGAFLQVAGGSPKAAAIAYVNNALVSRIPFVPLVGRTYVKMALKKMEQVLPNFDFCSR
jgi:hypothetical protein